MHDLTVIYRDRQQHEQTRQHTVPNLLTDTIDQMVDLFEGQIGTVVRVSYEGRILYQQGILYKRQGA